MRHPIVQIVSRHVEDAADLWNTRAMLVRAPHVKIRHISRFDERIAAHLDGIAIAGEVGWQCCEAALADASPGGLFAATVRAIEDANERQIDRLLSLAEALPDVRPGVIAAFGWVSAQHLRGIVWSLLRSSTPFRRLVGMKCCAMHRVDPGDHVGAAITNEDVALRAQALRLAGELGRDDLLPLCMTSLRDADVQCCFQAAWASVLLGDRGLAITKLVELGREPERFGRSPLQLALMAIERHRARELLTQIEKEDKDRRMLLRSVGAAGEIDHVPWLMSLMLDPKLSRLAGEMFSLITGADIAWDDLEQKAPQRPDTAPNDDPADSEVALEEDFGLPWPDPERVQRWWHEKSRDFQAGSRYFVGAPPSAQHCGFVLREGFQRQRIAAAYWTHLLRAEKVLFDCDAPAWRQRRWFKQ
jgi:uncharacterized protein (TIGR02270 family)